MNTRLFRGNLDENAKLRIGRIEPALGSWYIKSGFVHSLCAEKVGDAPNRGPLGLLVLARVQLAPLILVIPVRQGKKLDDCSARV